MQCAGAYITTPGGGGDVTGLAARHGHRRRPAFGVVRDVADVRERVGPPVDGGATVIKLIVTGAVLTRGTAARRDRARRGHGRGGGRGRAAGAGSSSRPMPTGPRGSSSPSGPASGRSSTRRSWTTRRSSCMVRHGTWLVADVYDGDWIDERGPACRLAGRDDGQEHAHDPGPARRLPHGGRGRASGSASGPTAGSTRTAGTRSSSATRSGSAKRRWMPSGRRRSSDAELMGWEDRVGSLARGRYADLVVLPADPLLDIEVLRHPDLSVVKGGRSVS